MIYFAQSIWNDFETRNIFDPSITKAKRASLIKAQKSYTRTFTPHLSGYGFTLHPKGKQFGSRSFAELLENKQEISCFIRGVYGFGDVFLQRIQTISLSSLTFSHQVMK